MSSDLALELLASGYRAIPEQRARAGGQPDFSTRLLGRRTLVVRGVDGARLFYDPTVVERHHAVPAALSGLLFGRGAIHGLDGAAHLLRKRMFLQILSAERVVDLADRVTARLVEQGRAWPGRDEVVLFNELATAYGFAVLEWAGVGCSASRAHRVVRDLAAIVDGFGGSGAAWVRGWQARLRADHWARTLVHEVRAGVRRPPETTALAVIAGTDLSPGKAAVELLNVLRPTVAIAWPGTFAALALHQHPAWRDRMPGSAEAFAHEVRRFYPFVPALTGLAARPFDHHGRRFAKGTRLVLDVPGTNCDRAVWADPEQFRPERFDGWQADAWSFVPQGGGYADAGHRCPGEPATVAVLARTVRVLADVGFEVPNPEYDMARIPTVPHGGLRLTGVRLPAGWGAADDRRPGSPLWSSG